MRKEKTIDMELFFSAMADRTRLRLLNLMRGGEVCVCFFAETLETNNPKISRHLSYLKRAGLVSGRRDGKWIHYKIVEPVDKNAAHILHSTFEMFDIDPEMISDRKKLNDISCHPQSLISITK